MSGYLIRASIETPQSEPLDERQVANSAGGYSYTVDKWARLRRFLILGSEGGSYYANERKLTRENVKCLTECIAEDGTRTVEEIATISDEGRAAKNDPALYALAVCISKGDKATKRAAAEALPRVARMSTHLFNFVAYATTLRGKGRTLRWAISNWYETKDADKLAYQAVKYRQREGWTHKDVLRLAHPKVEDAAARDAIGFMSGNVDHIPDSETGGRIALDWTQTENTPRMIEGYLKAQAAKTPKATAALVRDFGLPREALLTDHLTDIGVWEAMLESGMPMTALLRNLGNMTRIGVLDSRESLNIVTGQFGNQDAIRKSRLHPLTILTGLATYAVGHGMRGQNTWQPKPDVIDALHNSFYLAFGNVQPTGKRYLLGVDVSGSMTHGYVAGSPLSPREAAVAMALVTLNVEKDVEVMAFSEGFINLPISRTQRLDDAVKMTARMPFSGTDCSMPMRYAQQKRLARDVFVVYTDSETWHGNVHPMQALRNYRSVAVEDAKLIVCGMVSNGFTIADPQDAGALDVVGFDTATPSIISEFAAGRI